MALARLSNQNWAGRLRRSLFDACIDGAPRQMEVLASTSCRYRQSLLDSRARILFFSGGFVAATMSTNRVVSMIADATKQPIGSVLVIRKAPLANPS